METPHVVTCHQGATGRGDELAEAVLGVPAMMRRLCCARL